MDKQEAQRIANDFHNFLNTGNEELIKRYSLKTLRMALPHYEHWQKAQAWYDEIIRCIDELQRREEKEEDQSKTIKVKVEFAIFGCLLGILGILVAQWILSLFRKP